MFQLSYDLERWNEMVVHLNSLSFALAINHPNGALLIQQLVSILKKAFFKREGWRKDIFKS